MQRRRRYPIRRRKPRWNRGHRALRPRIHRRRFRLKETFELLREVYVTGNKGMGTVANSIKFTDDNKVTRCSATFSVSPLTSKPSKTTKQTMPTSLGQRNTLSSKIDALLFKFSFASTAALGKGLCEVWFRRKMRKLPPFGDYTRYSARKLPTKTPSADFS